MHTATNSTGCVHNGKTGWTTHLSIHRMLLLGWLASALPLPAISVIKLVTPNGWESRDGDSSTGDFVAPLRWQILIPSSQFDNLPAGQYLITRIAYRPDESIPSRFTSSTIRDHEVRLSTTSANHLSRTFANNVGADEKVVRRGDWTFSISSGGRSATHAFDFGYDLQTPFLYDTRQGKNLLYEEIFPHGMSAPAPVDQVGYPIFQVVGNSGTDVYGPTTYGPSQVHVPILQFTFVPVPVVTGIAVAGSHGRPVTLNLAGATNMPVVVKACTNILNPVWNEVGSVTLVNETNSVTDADSTNYTERFYCVTPP